jgi:hypothetical protein
MTNTLFIRLLQQENKGAALGERIEALREGRGDGDVYTVEPESFRQVPNTPFCYWVSERIRRLFTELPPFESEGRTVKVGLQTGDDFRFVRAWWEVPPERILDSWQYAGDGTQKAEDKWTEERIREFQAWCRRRTYEGKRWVPFAKGGEYSPYYADIHLVVNWENEGAEIRNFVDPKTGKTNSRPQNTDYYFRPGLTWGDRTSALLSVKPWPSGGVFSVKGSAGFFRQEYGRYISALMNSRVFNFFLEMMVSAGSIARSYQVGIIGSVPFKDPTEGCSNSLTHNASIGSKTRYIIDRTIDTSHAFILPALLMTAGEGLAERAESYAKQAAEAAAELRRIQSEVDEIAFDLYGFTEEERKAVFSDQWTVDSSEVSGVEVPNREDAEEKDSVRDSEPSLTTNHRPLVTDLLSWFVGVAFGRFDIRLALPTAYRLLPTDPPDPFDPLPVCPPGMLVGPDGLPAEANRIVSEEWLRARPDANTLPPEGSVKNPAIPDSEYPLRINWDGVLVDDPGFNGDRPHRDDIVRRVREVFDLLWKDKSHEIEQEACDILGVSDLREYFRKPSGFFQDHLKRYSKSRRKAPVYQPLSTASGSYTIWLYYHRLTDQTLYMVVNKYLEPKISEVERGIAQMESDLKAASSREATRLTDRLNDARTFLGELRDLREELLRIAALPYKPDLNDGVIINAAPLHKLFRLRSWAKDTEECWKKLAAGDYDWAHLAYTIWPDRVREACKRDRSIAIAHGLEDLCELEAPESKRKGGRGHWKKEAVR